ncbi:MAG: virulence RhuM family protein, partial [Candidatus Woesebacteria bacterium]|nr:virulence RhuM family protein [Candidatus Woesebacteria bacterium]
MKGLNRNNQIIIYNTEDGETKIEVQMKDDTVWLSQKQMAELFDCSADNISLHLKNIFKEAELSENSVTEESSATASDGKNYLVKHYNLDAIISVGYRINSLRGTQFRIWATQKLKEYIIKGFVMDDERLSEGRVKKTYFQEWEERIRKIHTSEANFYQKVRD